MLIDSHAHLDMGNYNEDLEQVIERAVRGGISRIITIGIDLESSYRALEIAEKYDFIYSTVGYHPHDADKVTGKKLEELKDLAKAPKVVAWGEIGLDFFKNRSEKDRQVDIFKTQLKIASELDLPVIIHNRDADDEIFRILNEQGSTLKGVIHCFSGDYDAAVSFIDMGFYISIPGIVTFKNAEKLRQVAAGIPIERMLVETDAPFLAPVPERGKRNEPLFVKYTAMAIAQLRGMDFEELASKTTENCKKLFGIS